MPNAVTISGAVEGLIDEAVLRRLIRFAGAEPGSIYGKHGKQFIRKQLDAYNRAARRRPWLVLVDMDHDADCAPAFVNAWLPEPAPNMLLRIVVREIEAWLLGDRERLAAFLNIPPSLVPANPDKVRDPKHVMVELARHSRRKDIRADMVPRKRSGRTVGPAYNSRLVEFVNDARRGWRPDVAAKSSESLRRCLERLHRIAKREESQTSISFD